MKTVSDGEVGQRAATCHNCGEVVDTSGWHPVATREDDDEFEILVFCDTLCRIEWTSHED